MTPDYSKPLRDPVWLRSTHGQMATRLCAKYAKRDEARIRKIVREELARAGK